MARPLQAQREALVEIARGRPDLGGCQNAAEAYRYCVRLCREALGLCVHCRERLAGNRCRDCAKQHPLDCCYCASCSCSCSAEESLVTPLKGVNL